jgi:hypothetical protein
MKLISFLLLVVGQACLAQTTISKSFPVQAGQKVNLYFDHPELIKVSTWDKNEVAVTGSVSINNGENDDAFGLTSSVSGGIVYIRGEMINLKSLPHRITIYRDDKKITFKNKEEYKKYASETGRDYNMMSTGVDIDIVLEVKVPRNLVTEIKSVYGMVEVRGFEGPIDVVSTYGGVDAALNEKLVGELVAETNYGQIYSNLDVKFTGGEEKNFHSLVIAKPGASPKQSFESKYGNVYLRKAL